MSPSTGAGLLYVVLQNSDGQVAVVDANGLPGQYHGGSQAAQLAAADDGRSVHVLGDDSVITVIELWCTARSSTAMS